MLAAYLTAYIILRFMGQVNYKTVTICLQFGYIFLEEEVARFSSSDIAPKIKTKTSR